MTHINTFLDENSSFLTKGACVKESSLGGYGIFTSSKLSEGDIVLRVPSEKVLDIYKLKQVRDVLVEKDTLGIVEKVIRFLLMLDIELSESALIWCYLCSFVLLRNDPQVDLGHIQWVLSYLDVLLKTPILDVDQLNIGSSDSILRDVAATKTEVFKLYVDLLEYHPPAAKFIKFEEAFQLFQAVRSRVLEIPCEIKGNANGVPGNKIPADQDSSNQEGNKDDFETNVSLVPMLDFANHSFHNNAVFDVDRASGDVVLRLIKPLEPNQEITICYSPVTEGSTRFMNRFCDTYGFLPSRGTFTWSIENFNETMNSNTEDQGGFNDFKKMAQWLRIPLELIFSVEKDGSVYIELTHSILPLLFIPGLKYNPNWLKNKEEIFEELKSQTDASADDLIHWLSEQEEAGEMIYGMKLAYGVLYNGSPVEVENIVNQTGILTEATVDSLELATMDAIIRTIQTTLDKDILETESTMIQQYHQAKKSILDRFIRNPQTK